MLPFSLQYLLPFSLYSLLRKSLQYYLPVTLDALTTLIEAYEAKHFQFNKIELTVVQVIEQTLEQLNLSKKDLSKILGSNRVSEIFSGKRDLSLAQIRILHKELRIPTDLLVGV